MDQDGQLTFADDPKTLKLLAANNLLQLGDFGQAAGIFHELFSMDPEFETAETGIRTAEFWNNRLSRITRIEDHLEKGKYLKEAWNKFEDFIGEENLASMSPVLAARQFIFTEAIHSFSRAYSTTIAPDMSIVYDIGECYFNIGDYVHAAETFEYAWEFKRDDSRTLARLADTYYMLQQKDSTDEGGAAKKARLLFREAFLYSPEEIELNRIRTPYIRRTIQNIIDEGFTEHDEIAAWTPVYAAIGRVFAIKRELEEHEVNRISEQCTALEAELKKSGINARVVLPGLLNRYLWLVDHFQLEKNDTMKVELIKKKFLEKDPQIYKKIFT